MLIVGIDLGTTNSLAAELDAAGRLQIVHNAEGSNLTPSVVWFESPTKAIVGIEARKRIDTGRYVFKEFKRDIGSDKTWPFFSGSTISPTELSAFVLRKIKNDLEQSVGVPDVVVVTVPANFRNEAREATIAAANSVGLNVQHIINEPTAAALYYAHSTGGTLNGNYVVYDLGGGTLDVSVIRARGNDVEVLASEGVQNLGGKDFDDKITELVARKFEQKTGLRFEKQSLNFNSIDAEEQKKSLSFRDNVEIRLVSREAGPVVLEVTRAEFETEISSLVAQAEMLCEGAIMQAGLGVTDITEVFLAGGSTRVPLIKRSVRKFFGKEPTIRANPDEVVALGAALYAAHKARNGQLNPMQQKSVTSLAVQDLAPAYFGTISLDSAKASQGISAKINNLLINKGEKLPCTKVDSFFTIYDKQECVNCTITQSPQPETDPRFVRILWSGQLALPPGRAKDQEIRVSFTYTENGTLNASFVDVASGKKTAIDVNAQNPASKARISVEDFIVE